MSSDQRSSFKYKFAVWATEHPWQFAGAYLLLIGATTIVAGVAVMVFVTA